MEYPARVPVCFREFMDLLSTLKEEERIEDLFNRMNWSGVKPRQIYSAILGRLPESTKTLSMPKRIRLQNTQVLRFGVEFKTNVIPRVLRAYPEKEEYCLFMFLNAQAQI
ncbi:MAG: hypothetical protein HWD60_05165 [Defluviicoccus sp.]|nr:MAG: hypothetical protein HWD60_05165 [Defluviicoccus sp.]